MMDQVTKKQIFFLLVALILVVGIIAMFSKSNNSTPIPNPSPTPKPESSKMCGGIAGLACPAGQTCVMKDNYPDASGICTP